MPDEVASAIEKALASQVAGLNRYPDRDALALREDLASYLDPESQFGLSSANVWAANGSNEVQQQILQTFGGPGRIAFGFSPSYSMHRLLALGTATGWIDGTRSEGFGLSAESAVSQVRENDPDIVFVCSPNNPTATSLAPDVIPAILAAARGIVVVDEAYAEFRRDTTPSALRLLAQYDRLLVTRTMSKAFACAGVRVGYVAAAPAVIDALQLVRLPYHLSSLTQVAARTALAHAPRLLATVAELRRSRDEMVHGLRTRGLVTADSDANFVLFGGFGRGTGELWRELLDRGVLIRDVGLPGWLRVSVGTPDENDAFFRTLDDVIGPVA
jgi:histidinol-phosphate aminotransferase